MMYSQWMLEKNCLFGTITLIAYIATLSGAFRVAYSDTSNSGYSGYIVELGPDVAQWSETKSKQSSSWRELKSI